MHAKKVAVARKGAITITQENIYFLMGLIISVIIIIGAWWFLLHNQYERIAKQNVYNLYGKISEVCSDGVERNIPFYLPQELGFRGWLFQNLGIPSGNVGTDPYFYAYYENFPPEGICTDPISGILCYWKEDLPWSNNLILTGVLDGIAGLPLGNKYTQKIGEAVRKGTFKIFSAADKALLKLSGGFYKGIKTSLRVGVDNFLEKIRGPSAAKILKLAEVDRELFRTIDEAEFRKNLIDAKIITEEGGKFILAPEYKQAVEEILKENPDYKFPLLEIEKTETGAIRNVIYDLKGHVDYYTEKIRNIFLKLNKLGYEDSLTTTGSKEFIEKFNALGLEKKAALYDDLGSKLPVIESIQGKFSPDKLIEFKAGKIDAMIKGLGDEIDHGGLVMIPRDSVLPEYLEKYGGTAFDQYIQDLSKNKGEGELLKGLFERKILYVPEKYEPLKYQATYAILRVQDIFTPLSVTGAEKYFSPSSVNCESGDLCLKMGSAYVSNFTLENTPCFGKGVTEIKLKRDSMVVSDPRFYLVSPCFAVLDITKEGNTIYIEPKICKNRPKGYENLNNYCFATKDMVNFYVSDEAASLVVGFIPGGGQAIQFGLDTFREAIITYPYAYELPIVGDKLLGDSVWEGQC